MIRSRGFRAIWAGFALLLATGRASALDVGPGATAFAPDLIQITGFVTTAPLGIDTIGSLTLGLPDGVTTLMLERVQLRNNSLTEGRAALRGVELFNPNLRVVGEASLLQAIRQATPQSELVLFGYLNSGSRRLHIVEVHPG